MPTETASSLEFPERLGGRILQAIDDTPVDPFAALEAERAPKRRGRKPGSKNKPKLPIAAMAAANEKNDILLPAAFPDTKLRRARGHETKLPAVLAASSPDRPRVNERFAWVRTKLRPGEKWKRRLPKVAW